MWPFKGKGKEGELGELAGSCSSDHKACAGHGKEAAFDTDPVLLCPGPNGLQKVLLTNAKGCTVEVIFFNLI